MAGTGNPSPVKYFIAVLYKDLAFYNRAKIELQILGGEIDFEGEAHNFDCTDYYEKEIGEHLSRRFISFAILRSPGELSLFKIRCNAIENNLSEGAGRKVNLDAGYLDHNKIVLASAKAAGQKIYLDHGIYADLVGRYRQGNYQPFEWSFPDFKSGIYNAELNHIRKIYLDQLKRS